MNGRLDKVAMTNKLMQLKRELHYKCEIGEKGEWECKGPTIISTEYLMFWTNIGNNNIRNSNKFVNTT